MARIAARSLPTPDPRLVRALRRLALCGALLGPALPAARGANAWVGAWPLWLVAMPLASLWALHRFQVPRWPVAVMEGDAGIGRERRRRSPQARRRRQYPAASRAFSASMRPISISSAARQNS
jgi:hypothetical protein